MRFKLLVVTVVAGGAMIAASAQEREDRTLLTQEQMTAIINEASGERAMHHVLDLVPYQRVRSPEGYSGPFRAEPGDGAVREGVTGSATSRSRSSSRAGRRGSRRRGSSG